MDNRSPITQRRREFAGELVERNVTATTRSSSSNVYSKQWRAAHSRNVHVRRRCRKRYSVKVGEQIPTYVTVDVHSKVSAKF